MFPLPISVIVLTFNSAEHIRACLESVQTFAEVVVCDNGSTDQTLAIVQEFANVTVMCVPFCGFGPLRRLATAQAKQDWILALDSDERLSPALLREMASLRLDEKMVYSFSRRNHFNKKPIRCCGWHPDYVMRLFNRRVTTYSNTLVHESVVVQTGMRVQKLAGTIDHYPYANVASLLNKMQSYSDLYARQHAHTRQASVFVAVVRALVTFCKNYFLQGAFLEGADGFLIAVSNANGVFYKYMKLRELNRL